MKSTVITPGSEYANKLKAALGTVLDLASQDMLDEHDAKEEPLKTAFKEQQKDMGVVISFYESL